MASRARRVFARPVSRRIKWRRAVPAIVCNRGWRWPFIARSRPMRGLLRLVLWVQVIYPSIRRLVRLRWRAGRALGVLLMRRWGISVGRSCLVRRAMGRIRPRGGRVFGMWSLLHRRTVARVGGWSSPLAVSGIPTVACVRRRETIRRLISGRFSKANVMWLHRVTARVAPRVCSVPSLAFPLLCLVLSLSLPLPFSLSLPLNSVSIVKRIRPQRRPFGVLRTRRRAARRLFTAAICILRPVAPSHLHRSRRHSGVCFGLAARPRRWPSRHSALARRIGGGGRGMARVVCLRRAVSLHLGGRVVPVGGRGGAASRLVRSLVIGRCLWTSEGRVFTRCRVHARRRLNWRCVARAGAGRGRMRWVVRWRRLRVARGRWRAAEHR